jgi:hypothetical protein
MSIRTAEEYREEARRVREMAAHMDRLDMREVVREIADIYERLAESAEKLVPRQAPSGTGREKT